MLDGLCLYYEKWTDDPLTVNQDVFTSFMSALKMFQENSLPGRVIKSIDLFNARLSYLNSKYFYIIVRERFQKPFERTVQQLKNISNEIEHLIDDFKENKFAKDDIKPASLEDYQKLFSPVIHNILDLEEIAELQLKTFDFIVLIYLDREIKNLILIIASERVFVNISRTNKNQWFYDAIMNETNIEPSFLKDANYKEVLDYLTTFICQMEENFYLYKENPCPEKLEKGRKELIKFLAMNSHTISKYNLLETILKNVILIFK